MNDKIKNGFTYSAFGMIISSQVELPGFKTSEQSADVRIVYGRTPEKIENANPKTSKIQVSQTEFLLVKKNIRYYVKDGQQIIIEAPKRAKKDVLVTYLTSVCFAVVLFQRGAVPIHGSCVIIDGRGVIFTGVSGVGKSSLCYAYRKNQHRFLADEISVVSLNDHGDVIVQPGSSQQRLCRNVIKENGLHKFELSKSHDRKFLLCSDLNYEDKPALLSAVFEIKKGKRKRVDSTKITGTEKLRCFINNIYYVSFLSGMGISKGYFSECSEIAGKLDYYHLYRPKKGNTIQTQMQHVIDTIVRNAGIQ